MADLDSLVDDALGAVSRLRALIIRQRGRQVVAREPRSAAKATSLAWFKGIRPDLGPAEGSPWVRELDAAYRELLDATERATSKARYRELLREIKVGLVALRADVVTLPLTPSGVYGVLPPPDFGNLVPDTAMQAVLQRRWREAQLCRGAGAHLAATVMMGSLLEALLLARINSAADKSPVFKAKAAPKDKTAKTLPMREWTLRDYIDVAHELGWIRQSARDVGTVLRDYRNYVHPAKEYAHSMVLDGGDTDMFWAICATLTTQVLSSARSPS